MFRKKNKPRKKPTKKQDNNKQVIKRLLEISLRLDDHIYKDITLSSSEAQKYLHEITNHKMQCKGARSLQVIDKLTRLMRNIIVENSHDNEMNITSIVPTHDDNNAINNSQQSSNKLNNLQKKIIDVNNENSIIEIDEVNIHKAISNLSIHDAENISNSVSDVEYSQRIENDERKNILIECSDLSFQHMPKKATAASLNIIDLTCSQSILISDEEESTGELIHQKSVNHKERDFFQNKLHSIVEEPPALDISEDHSQSILDNVQITAIEMTSHKKNVEAEKAKLPAKPSMAANRLTKVNNQVSTSPNSSTIKSKKKFVPPKPKENNKIFEMPYFTNTETNSNLTITNIDSQLRTERLLDTEASKAKRGRIYESQEKSNEYGVIKKFKGSQKENKPKTKEQDLSWVENIKYVRIISPEECDSKIKDIGENFWNNFSISSCIDDQDFVYKF